jgi:hypothetical protein
MKLKHCALVAVAALLLGACNSAGEPLPTHTPAPTAQPTSTTPSTATTAPTLAPTVAPPTATEPPPSTATQPPPPPTATPTPSVPAFLEVRPDDWVHGPADAEVTIIEYSDYQ